MYWFQMLKLYNTMSRKKEEFVRRTGFALMAALSVHDKKAKDKEFEKFFPLVKKYANDERNFVKKAVLKSVKKCRCWLQLIFLN